MIIAIILGLLALVAVVVMLYFVVIGIAGLITAGREVGKGVRKGLAAPVPPRTSRKARKQAQAAAEREDDGTDV